MAPHPTDRSVQPLVELEHGRISREIFVNETIYQQEQEQLFARTWLFVGHESQILSREITSSRAWGKSQSS